MNPKYLFIILLLLTSCASKRSAKNFEGVIYSTAFYSSKIDSLNATELFGQERSEDVLYIKDGYYKAISTTDFMSYSLWRYDDTLVYFLNAQSKDTLWTDRTDSHPGYISKYEIIKNADTILNYACDALIVENDYGHTLTYYYSTQLSLDPEYYVNVKNSAKYDILKLMKSVYLKLKIESNYGTMESVPTRIEQKKLDDKTFELPKHSVMLEAKY